MGHRSTTSSDPSLDGSRSQSVRHSGDSPPAQLDPKLCLRAAQSACTLLLTGETGVGKGHLAWWLHSNSPRVNGPFIPVNCGAIPEDLIDSQLFGHAKGSFTGASTDHLGLVRAAEKGTLLLDEISELPSSAQNRLLRLLQDREVAKLAELVGDVSSRVGLSGRLGRIVGFRFLVHGRFAMSV